MNKDKYDINLGRWGSCDMYSIEYKCTSDETEVTTQHIITVKLSNWNPQAPQKEAVMTEPTCESAWGLSDSSQRSLLRPTDTH